MKLAHKLVLILAALTLASCEVKLPQLDTSPVAEAPSGTLISAARDGDVALATAHLDRGADPNMVDAEELTPLHHSSFGGHVAVIQLLLKRGALVDARDMYGFTPLHGAARDGQLAAVTALVEGGADVNAVERESLTPAQIAVFMRHQSVADYLYAHGARREVPAEPTPEVVALPAVPEVPAIWLTGEHFRVWTSASGAQIEAELVQCVMDTVTLRKRDSQLVRIHLNQLKPVDQVVVRQMSGVAPPILVRQRAARADKPGASDSIGLKIGRGGGWDVLENCRLLKKSGNDGDSFHVTHDGKEYIFRLYYVDTPETDMAFPDRVAEQSRYFKLKDSETLRIAEEAKLFTDRILSRGPFTVVTKWEDARGNSRLPRQYALVVTDQGDLDELLTAEGFVRVYGMHVDGSYGSRKESELKSLERDAKRERAGAWGVGKRDEAMAQ